MNKKLSAAKLKLLIWGCQPEVYFDKEMLTDKTCYGECTGNQIVLHPKIKNLKELIDTFTHEMLHMVLPEAEEEEIRKYTRKVLHSYTSVERVHVIIKLGQHLKKANL